ncbi:MAG: NAD-dependent epimerase/dehydratase family protein [Planctomycetota bacterium]|nr:NAD-dependent epimerase/dehydratase family protein [Planctomycetota bacterium]
MAIDSRTHRFAARSLIRRFGRFRFTIHLRALKLTMPIALITGSSGFIGQHVLAQFPAFGWTAIGLARNPNKCRPEVLRNGSQVVQDPGNYDGFCDLLHELHPDVIIHLATRYIKDHKPSDIPDLIRSNIAYGAELLEAMRSCGVQRLVIAGTTWQHHLVDDEQYVPSNFYAATKQAFEDLVRWYVDACGFSAIALRLTDTYGPDDPRRKLFTLLQEAAQSGEPLRMSPGEQLLDPLFVDDAVAAFAVAAHRILQVDHRFEIYRVTPGQPRKLRDIVTLWCQITGKNPTIMWGGVPYREREVMRPWTGGKVLPGWKPAVSLEEGIRRCWKQ